MESSEAYPPRLQSPSVTTSATSPLTVTTRASGRGALGDGMGWGNRPRAGFKDDMLVD